MAIAGTELRRFVRDRSNIFFVLIFPMLLVLVLGLQFGGGSEGGRVAIAGSEGELRTAITQELQEAGTEVTVTDPEEMRTQVARERVHVGLLIDDDAEEAFASGEEAQIDMITTSTGNVPVVQQQVNTALEALNSQQAEMSALTQMGVGAEEASAALEQARQSVTPVQVTVVNLDAIDQEFAGVGQFDLSAATMLLLFVFVNALSSSVTLIQSRQLGVQARVVAAPVSAPAAIGGQVLGRWVIGFVQGGYIMIASMVLFDVDFGDIGAALVLIAVFGAVAAGAAMLLGSLLDHTGAATGVSIGLGLVLAAMGGLMFPLELFPDRLYTVALFTPHAWGYEAFAEIQRNGGGVLDILPQLGVLAAIAIMLIALGAVALRRAVARAM